ncbi:hypothetical protein DSO57_1022216 [Entomophthora muscae]|uniref:Uncharacterized protein n=1 Tax=Entomophthora muscae TaxID=34485 RepID=A0ACC2U142_9FUNG|nr:hypothetical protein DSO57_1022216 [Entomophthora muscae]
MMNQNVGSLPKPLVYVSFLMKPASFLSHEEAYELVLKWIQNNPAGIKPLLKQPGHISVKETELTRHLKSIQIISPESGLDDVNFFTDCSLSIHPYRLLPNTEYVNLNGTEQEEGQTAAIRCCNLPNPIFEGLWKSLIFEEDLKARLLSYVKAVAEFGERGVDDYLVGLNRLVLLHGPPGTGKTSLARALAQSVSIVLGSRFDQFQLLELNCHGLYSRWFSESSKAVVRAFDQLQELARQPRTFLMLLVDEVESVAMDRGSSLGGHEPTDGIRVVNALLTQLDKLRAFPNVIVVATSNMTKAIDAAVVDRADICMFVGTPSQTAIKMILHGALSELILKRVIELPHQTEPLTLDYIHSLLDSDFKAPFEKAVHYCQGISGRQLRKLPFITYASCTCQVILL